MIIVCEPQCAGFEHVEFNAALIAVMSAAFPGEAIGFYAEKEHLQLVKAGLAARAVEGITYSEVEVPPRNATAHRRFPQERKLYRRIFDIAEGLGTQKVLFSSTTGPGLISMKILMGRYRNVRCVVIPHGELESLMKHRPSLKPFVFGSYLDLPFWFRTALLYGNSWRITYLVLSASFEDRICRRFPALGEMVRSMEMPYFFREPEKFVPFADGTVKFGSLGVGVRNKGIDLFFRAAEEILKGDPPQKAEFIHIGKLGDKIALPKDGCVTIPSPHAPLGRREYEGHAASVDYAVFFSRHNAYRLTASATLFDAFSYLKPVIALKNPFFEHFFETMGDIGHLCGDYEEMKEVMLGLIKKKDVGRYRLQRDNILRGRREFSIPELGKKIADLWQDDPPTSRIRAPKGG